MAIRNPTWQRDELILALDLYFKHNPSSLNSTHEEVIKLSKLLNSLPIHNIRPDELRFRNPNGVYMKLCNFLRYDPAYKGVGLQRGGKLEEKIWNEFGNNPEYLSKIANSIMVGIDYLSAVGDGIENSKETFLSPNEELEFPEGKVLYRLHKIRERNRKLVSYIKNEAIKTGKFYCELCGFDYYETYGELGKGYIQCHHIEPLSNYSNKHVTKAEDLILVCANCHCMLHRKRPWLKKSELSNLLVKSCISPKTY